MTPQGQLESPRAAALIWQVEAKTLQKAAVKYDAVNIAKHIPQIHGQPPFDRDSAAQKLEETELKKPQLLVICLMEADAQQTCRDGWAVPSYIAPASTTLSCIPTDPRRPLKTYTQLALQTTNLPSLLSTPLV